MGAVPPEPSILTIRPGKAKRYAVCRDDEALLPLSQEDRKQITDELLQEFEREHIAREQSRQQRSEHLHSRAHARHEKSREQEIQTLRLELKDQFYKDKGYRLYTDSSGRERWLSPTEWEWKQRHPRGKKRHRTYEIVQSPQYRVLAAYVFIGIIAIIAGFMLSR